MATEPVVAPPPGSPPGDPPGDPPSDRGKTYTEKDLQQRLQGQGKELKRLQEAEAARKTKDDKAKAESEAARLKQLEEDGKYKDLYEQKTADLAERDAKLKSIQARETARLEHVTSENEKRTKVLSKALQDLIPGGLDADALAIHLAKLEAIHSKKVVVDVKGSGGKGGGSGATDPNEIAAGIGSTIMGTKKPGGAS